ncbi:MAG: NAD(P)-dependent oxidoreductase [Candidatus Bathyarchaeia archaeon]|nr:NAD(P)-dependent oxidoreductase [Candidatus Bathyarchaeota archaeon]
MRRVLVSGLGLVGSNIAAKLLREGYSVVGYDIRPTHKLHDPIFRRELERIEFVEGDVTDFSKYLQVAKDYDVEGIIHTPAAVMENWQETVKVNVIGALNALEIGRLLNLRRVLYISSGSVFGDREDLTPIKDTDPVSPRSYYGLTKCLAEIMVNAYYELFDLSAAAVRLSGVFGRGWHQMEFFIQGTIFLALEGERIQVVDHYFPYTYINDVTEALYLLYTKPGKLKYTLYSVSSEKGATWESIVSCIKKNVPQANIELIKPKPILMPEVQKREWRGGPSLIRGPFAMERMKEEFGWTPKYTVEEGIEEFIQYIKRLKEEEPEWYAEQVKKFKSLYRPPPIMR